MGVHHISAVAQIENHAIARDLRNGQVVRSFARRFVGEIAHHLDNCARGYRENVDAIVQPLFRLLAVSRVGVPLCIHFDPVDGKSFTGIQRPVHRVGHETMRPDLQATTVRVHPAVSLHRRTQHNRVHAAYLHRPAHHHGLGHALDLRDGNGHPVRDGARYLAGIGVGDIEEHHAGLASGNLGRVVRLVLGIGEGKKLDLASHVFVLDAEHAVATRDFVVLRKIHHFHRIDGCRETPHVGEHQFVREMSKAIRSLHGIDTTPQHMPHQRPDLERIPHAVAIRDGFEVIGLRRRFCLALSEAQRVAQPEYREYE